MRTTIYSVCLALLLPTLAWGQVGEVRFAQGDVRVERANGKTERLEKGSKLAEGDTIVTGADAYAQLQMVDQGVIAVRSQTRLKLDTYRFQHQGENSDSGILSLIRGGFRSITGLIGAKNKAAYSVRTPSATIGIRGTDHEILVVLPPAPGETPVGQPGTYNKVNTGETFIETPNGRVNLQANQAGFAPLASNTPPVRLPQIPSFMRSSPPVVSDAPAGGTSPSGTSTTTASATDGSGTSSGAGTSATSTQESSTLPTTTSTASGETVVLAPLPVGTVPPPPTEGSLDPKNLPAGSVPAPMGTAMAGGDLTSGKTGNGAAFIGNPQENFAAMLDSSGHLLALNGANFSYSRDAAPRIFEGSASVGSDTINWGIYAGGTIQDEFGLRNPQYFHYMIGGQASTQAGLLSVMPNPGNPFTVSTVYGYTKPITEAGSVGGTVNSLTVTLQNVGGNFNLQTYNLSVTDADGRGWSAGLASSVSLATFISGGAALNVGCTGCPGGPTNGMANGVPIGNPVSAVISSYNLNAGTASVTGSVLSK